MGGLKEMPKVGDKIRVLNSNGWGRLVRGNVYAVTAVYGDYFDLHDGFGRYDIIVWITYARDFELVTDTQSDIRLNEQVGLCTVFERYPGFTITCLMCGSEDCTTSTQNNGEYIEVAYECELCGQVG